MAPSSFWGSSSGGSSSSTFWGSGSGSSSKSSSFWGAGGAPKSGGGGGFLGALKSGFSEAASPFEFAGHLAAKTGENLVSASEHFLPGMYDLGKTAVKGDIGVLTGNQKEQQQASDTVGAMVKQQVKQTKADFAHPLRNPGYTGLDVLGLVSGGTGAAARLGEAGRALSAGERIGVGERLGGAAKALATKPKPVTRLISHDGVSVKLPAATNPFTRTLQKGVDQLRMKFPDVPLVGAAKIVGKENLRGLRYGAQLQKAPVNTMLAYAKQAGMLKRVGKVGPYTMDALARQHALRVVAEGVPTDERIAFHQSMLDKGFTSGATDAGMKAMRERDFVEGHQDQIALNQAAKKYLDETGGKPKLTDPGMQRVYDQMVKVAGSREKLLAQIGRLTDETAAGRVNAPGRVLKGATFDEEHGLQGVEDFTGGDVRVPTQPAYKSPRSTKTPPTIGASHGIAEPKAPGSLTHPYTGAAYAGGKIRNDVVRLMAESALETQRYWTLLHVTDGLKAAAKDAPTSAHDIPIVTDKLPGRPSLRETVARLNDESSPSRSAELGALSHGYEGLRQALFPNFTRDESGVPQLAEPIPGVKYVDERLLGGLNKPNPLLGLQQHAAGRGFLKTVDAINNASKVAILYLKPAYVAPNLLSNVASNIVQQGFAAPVNLARAAKLWAKADPEIVKNVLSAMGEGFAGSLDAETGFAGKAAHFGASAWAKPVDVLPRLAAFLYEARRDGITDTAGLRQLFDDPAKADTLDQVMRRANSAMIDFGNLTPVEQSIIRRVVFFYPWVKGSAVWFGKFPVEHPLQAAATVPVSRFGRQQQEDALGAAIPSWAQTLIPTGQTGAHGLPETFNPFTVTPFDQTGQLAQSVGAILSGHPAEAASSVAEMLSPGAGVIATGATKGLPAALKSLYANLPVVLEAQQAMGKGSKTYPDEGTGLQALLRYLIGTGFVPRETSTAELAKAAYAQAHPRKGG